MVVVLDAGDVDSANVVRVVDADDVGIRGVEVNDSEWPLPEGGEFWASPGWT